MYFLAIDIGASSGRHVLGWKEKNTLVTEEIHRFPNEMIEKSGALCWDIDAIFGEILTGMKKCAKIEKIPASVGICTWGVDFVLGGEAVSYRDSRTVGMDVEVEKYISDVELYSRTGIQKMSFNTIYQLMYLKKARKMPVQPAKMLMIPDYFHFLLSGKMKTEYTNATTTGLVCAKTRNWDYEIIEKLGFPRDIFCEIVTPGTNPGYLLPEIQKKVGYNCRVILPATHDTASAVVAVPSKKNALFISSGTWSLMGTVLQTAITTEQSRQKNFTNEGGYKSTFRYLKNIMGLWLIQSIKKEFSDRFSYQELNDMAKNSKIESIINANDPRLFAPKSMTQVINELCAETIQQIPANPADYAAIIYNSLAHSYAKTAHEIEDITNEKFTEICIVGGGTKAQFLNTLTAKFSNKTITLGASEATAEGNLIVQMENYV